MEFGNIFDKDSITTIKLKSETKERLNNLRVYPRETFDEILQKVLEILNICRNNPDQARIKLIAIDKQRRALSKKS